MNVYDFDGTIYDGDSGRDFILFAFSKRPFYMAKHFLKLIKYFIKYKRKKINFKEMKERVFSFVKNFNDLEELKKEFIQRHMKKVKPYYSEVRKDDDIIISASLDFYLIDLCKAIGINNVVCTEYDVKSGKIINENCKGEEKVKRFDTIYGKDTVINNAYGDSKHDVPILKRAVKGYIVKGNELIEYDENYKF